MPNVCCTCGLLLERTANRGPGLKLAMNAANVNVSTRSVVSGDGGSAGAVARVVDYHHRACSGPTPASLN